MTNFQAVTGIPAAPQDPPAAPVDSHDDHEALGSIVRHRRLARRREAILPSRSEGRM